LQKKITQEQLQEQLSFAIKHYAKRQMTWFRKNENIVWVAKPSEVKSLVENFLK
jgi:tRNA A37 N6-isopentenylltransferase MiaA